MALIPVRAKQPRPDGTYLETEVGEEHLVRWPEDFDRIDDLDTASADLEQAGVPAEQIGAAAAAPLAPAGAEPASDTTAGAVHVPAVDPSVSSD